MTHASYAAADALLDPRTHADGRADGIWREMRAAHPWVRHEPDGYPAFWSVTRYDDVRSVYADPESFSSEGGVLLRPSVNGEDPGTGLTLALTDPPRHNGLRSMLAPHFNERSARALADRLRQDVRDVLARAADSGEFDFARDVAGRLSSLLIARLLGVPDADLDTVVRWIEEAFAAAKPMTSHVPLTRYVIDLMEQRDEEPADDAISLLLDGEVDEELLTETEVLLNCENLLGASENAGLSIAAGMAALLDHPEQWHDLREHPEIQASAVEEILRWGSSATHSMRTATSDMERDGQRIRKGERVVLWVRSANRDEKEFDRPEEFDLRRKPNRHLALGFGPHVCIGQTMARHQSRILLDELVTSVASFEQAGPVTPLASIAVNGPARLPMRLKLK
ncbi:MULTISPECIES: cytochrome P450 [unclassified Streptomyces]|uniref:cytochrome P450 n=1 Tax=unclassified Streptomyces TaxID=2593676 RepID=UPI001BE89E02|nr:MULTISPECIES: cytochrome P450 [unclassified Streptomyces]MBT2408149.1 cytochrome P450 [Streptomyces sp. ISL-21]MBT2456047.1 cytochrome P450 [Streptomyces sp. ISL-86]MBT2609293.1 cytochrome P450 [Streptomyces sp. ISL-87]